MWRGLRATEGGPDEACRNLAGLTAERDALLAELERQVAFYAMDLTFMRGHADDTTIKDIEYRRDSARDVVRKVKGRNPVENENSGEIKT